jgi:tripartite-type tricarboxylate transporter receptor subunit TctC
VTNHGVGRRFECSTSRRRFIGVVAAVGAAPVSSTLADTEFPARAVRIINPFAPGGNTDIVARLLGNYLSDAWGRPVVVENKAGAGATLGTDSVAKSSPDGHTLQIGTLAGTAIAPSVYRKLPYNPQEDLASISGLTIGYSAIGITPSLPIRTLSELIEYARKRPEKVFYSSPGRRRLEPSSNGEFSAHRGAQARARALPW